MKTRAFLVALKLVEKREGANKGLGVAHRRERHGTPICLPHRGFIHIRSLKYHVFVVQ